MGVHRRLTWRTDPGGTAYRVRRSFPAGPAHATVLLAGPGSVSSLDGTGRDDRLLDELTDRLVGAGVQVLQCDMPARDGEVASGEDDEQGRADRLHALLEGHHHLLSGPLTLIGFSLGGQALLRLLGAGMPARADRVVLVGTVIEEDVLVTSRVGALTLVYGGQDVIGYLVDENDGEGNADAANGNANANANGKDGGRSGGNGGGGRNTPLPPAMFEPLLYADWSARHLVGPGPLDVRVRVLPGLGHTLHPCGPGPALDPLTTLADLAGAAT